MGFVVVMVRAHIRMIVMIARMTGRETVQKFVKHVRQRGNGKNAEGDESGKMRLGQFFQKHKEKLSQLLCHCQSENAFLRHRD